MAIGVQQPTGLLRQDKKSDVAYVVGCGPTIDDIDVSALKGKEVFALNAAITLFKDHPRAFWFFRDGRAGPEVIPRLESWGRIRMVTTLIGYRRLKDMSTLARRNHVAYVYDRQKVRHERSVIEDVLQILARAEFRKVYLVGVDHRMREGRPYANAFSWKECFWHDPQKPHPDPDLPLKSFVEGLRKVAEDLPKKLQVFNTSTIYPEEIFPHVPFEEAVRDA